MVSPLLTSLAYQPLGLPMTHRFGVVFFRYGLIPNPMDIRFQSVSGIGSTIRKEDDPTSSNSIVRKVMPTGIEHKELVLKRGLVMGSSLSYNFQTTMNTFKFTRSDVMVTIFSEIGIPSGAWMFTEAFAVGWELDDLSAQGESVLIETMTLAYTNVRYMGL